MLCAECGHDFAATNQHTVCPKCGEAVGTDKERDLVADHAEKLQWYKSWEEMTQQHRERTERDLRYYHGIQWSDDEKKEILARGQAPIVINRIRKKLNYLFGSEIRNRTDPKARPRTPKHDDDSDAATDILRYIADAEDYNGHDTKNFKDLLRAGICGTVIEHEVSGKAPASYGDGTQASQAPDEREVEVRRRYVPWDRLFWDPHSRESDFSDALYRGIVTWMDLADAKRYYGSRPDTAADFEQVLEDTSQRGQSAGDSHDDKPSGWYDSKRRRVRIAETYYQKDGEYYVCHETGGGFVVRPKPTGYVDKKGKNVCPLLMTSAYVNTETGERYGLIRDMIGPQDEINKRRSKALYLISVDRTVAEDGVVLDPHAAKQERAKPDGWVTVQHNALSEGRVQFQNGLELANAQVQMQAEAKQEIDQTGPDAPMLNSSGATSGVQLQLQQQIGSLELEPVVDNHRRMKRDAYRHTFWRASQFWTYKKVLRVTDDAESAGYRFVHLNRQTSKGQRMQELMKNGMSPEGALQAVNVPVQAIQQHVQQAQQQQQAMQVQMMAQRMGVPPEAVAQQMPQPDPTQIIMAAPEMQEPYTTNDVAELDVDIVLDEAPDTAIVQQEELINLREIGQSMVAAGQPFPLEMYIEASQLRSKKKLLAMVKQSQEQGPAQQAQMQQMQQQMQMMAAQIESLQAKTMRDKAEAEKTQVETQLLPGKAQAETQAKQASAMHAAASAGEKAGGAGPMQPGHFGG